MTTPAPPTATVCGADDTLAQRVAALADEYERRCDAVAITYQDPETRARATGGGRRIVRELRGLLEPKP